MEQEGNIVVEYAGFWRRLAAFLIDGFAIISIYWAIATSWMVASGAPVSRSLEGWYGPSLFNDPLAPLIVPAGAVYFILFWKWRGQTPGKMILNIKVLKYDGTHVTYSTAVLRYLGYIVCFLTLGIGFIILAFDERRQGLHDKMSFTVVVKIPPVKIKLPEASMG